MNESTSPREPRLSAQIELDRRAPWFGPAAFVVVILVFLLATVFEAAVVADRESLRDLAGDALGTPAFSVREYAVHIEWRASAILFLGAGLAALLVAGRIVWSAVRRTPLQVGVILALEVAVLLATTWVVDSSNSTAFMVQVAGLLESEGADANVPSMAFHALLPKRCADFIAAVIGVAAASIVVLPSRIDAAGLAARVRSLRTLLYVSAVLFAVGILMTERSYSWLVSFFGNADADARLALEGAVSAGTQLAGAFYTVLLAATYLPAAAILGHVGRRLAAEAVEALPEQEAAEWLEEQGLSISWRGQLARIGAIAAPLLSAAVAHVLSTPV